MFRRTLVVIAALVIGSDAAATAQTSTRPFGTLREQAAMQQEWLRKRLETFLRISFPQALPSIFAGLKVSITLAVVGAVVGEFVGSNSGIGYLLQIANGNFDLPLMFAALTVLSGIGVVLFVAIDVVERLLIPWDNVPPKL